MADQINKKRAAVLAYKSSVLHHLEEECGNIRRKLDILNQVHPSSLFPPVDLQEPPSERYHPIVAEGDASVIAALSSNGIGLVVSTAVALEAVSSVPPVTSPALTAITDNNVDTNTETGNNEDATEPPAKRPHLMSASDSSSSSLHNTTEGLSPNTNQRQDLPLRPTLDFANAGYNLPMGVGAVNSSIPRPNPLTDGSSTNGPGVGTAAAAVSSVTSHMTLSQHMYDHLSMSAPPSSAGTLYSRTLHNTVVHGSNQSFTVSSTADGAVGAGLLPSGITQTPSIPTSKISAPPALPIQHDRPVLTTSSASITPVVGFSSMPAISLPAGNALSTAAGAFSSLSRPPSFNAGDVADNAAQRSKPVKPVRPAVNKVKMARLQQQQMHLQQLQQQQQQAGIMMMAPFSGAAAPANGMGGIMSADGLYRMGSGVISNMSTGKVGMPIPYGSIDPAQLADAAKQVQAGKKPRPSKAAAKASSQGGQLPSQSALGLGSLGSGVSAAHRSTGGLVAGLGGGMEFSCQDGIQKSERDALMFVTSSQDPAIKDEASSSASRKRDMVFSRVMAYEKSHFVAFAPPAVCRRPKTHWDMVMDEAQWMAIDFRQEFRMKVAHSAAVARMCSEAARKRFITREAPPQILSTFDDTRSNESNDSEFSEVSSVAKEEAASLTLKKTEKKAGARTIIPANSAGDTIAMEAGRDQGTIEFAPRARAAMLSKLVSGFWDELRQPADRVESSRLPVRSPIVPVINSGFSVGCHSVDSQQLEDFLREMEAALSRGKQSLSDGTVIDNMSSQFFSRVSEHQRIACEKVLARNREGYGAIMAGPACIGKTAASVAIADAWLHSDRVEANGTHDASVLDAVLLLVPRKSVIRWASECFRVCPHLTCSILSSQKMRSSSVDDSLIPLFRAEGAISKTMVLFPLEDIGTLVSCSKELGLDSNTGSSSGRCVAWKGIIIDARGTPIAAMSASVQGYLHSSFDGLNERATSSTSQPTVEEARSAVEHWLTFIARYLSVANCNRCIVNDNSYLENIGVSGSGVAAAFTKADYAGLLAYSCTAKTNGAVPPHAWGDWLSSASTVSASTLPVSSDVSSPDNATTAATAVVVVENGAQQNVIPSSVSKISICSAALDALTVNLALDIKGDRRNNITEEVEAVEMDPLQQCKYSAVLEQALAEDVFSGADVAALGLAVMLLRRVCFDERMVSVSDSTPPQPTPVETMTVRSAVGGATDTVAAAILPPPVLDSVYHFEDKKSSQFQQTLTIRDVNSSALGSLSGIDSRRGSGSLCQMSADSTSSTVLSSDSLEQPSSSALASTVSCERNDTAAASAMGPNSLSSSNCMVSHDLDVMYPAAMVSSTARQVSYHYFYKSSTASASSAPRRFAWNRVTKSAGSVAITESSTQRSLMPWMSNSQSALDASSDPSVIGMASCKVRHLHRLLKRFSGMRIVVAVETDEECVIVHNFLTAHSIKHLYANGGDAVTSSCDVFSIGDRRFAVDMTENEHDGDEGGIVHDSSSWFTSQLAIRDFNVSDSPSILLLTNESLRPPAYRPSRVDVIFLLSEDWATSLAIKDTFLLQNVLSDAPVRIVRVVTKGTIEEQIFRTSQGNVQTSGEFPEVHQKYGSSAASIPSFLRLRGVEMKSLKYLTPQLQSRLSSFASAIDGQTPKKISPRLLERVTDVGVSAGCGYVELNSFNSSAAIQWLGKLSIYLKLAEKKFSGVSSSFAVPVFFKKARHLSGQKPGLGSGSADSSQTLVLPGTSTTTNALSGMDVKKEESLALGIGGSTLTQAQGKLVAVSSPSSSAAHAKAISSAEDHEEDDVIFENESSAGNLVGPTVGLFTDYSVGSELFSSALFDSIFSDSTTNCVTPRTRLRFNLLRTCLSWRKSVRLSDQMRVDVATDIAERDAWARAQLKRHGFGVSPSERDFWSLVEPWAAIDIGFGHNANGTAIGNAAGAVSISLTTGSSGSSSGGGGVGVTAKVGPGGGPVPPLFAQHFRAAVANCRRRGKTVDPFIFVNPLQCMANNELVGSEFMAPNVDINIVYAIKNAKPAPASGASKYQRKTPKPPPPANAVSYAEEAKRKRYAALEVQYQSAAGVDLRRDRLAPKTVNEMKLSSYPFNAKASFTFIPKYSSRLHRERDMSADTFSLEEDLIILRMQFAAPDKLFVLTEFALNSLSGAGVGSGLGAWFSPRLRSARQARSRLKSLLQRLEADRVGPEPASASTAVVVRPPDNSAPHRTVGQFSLSQIVNVLSEADKSSGLAEDTKRVAERAALVRSYFELTSPASSREETGPIEETSSADVTKVNRDYMSDHDKIPAHWTAGVDYHDALASSPKSSNDSRSAHLLRVTYFYADPDPDILELESPSNLIVSADNATVAAEEGTKVMKGIASTRQDRSHTFDAPLSTGGFTGDDFFGDGVDMDLGDMLDDYAGDLFGGNFLSSPSGLYGGPSFHGRSSSFGNMSAGINAPLTPRSPRLVEEKATVLTENKPGSSEAPKDDANSALDREKIVPLHRFGATIVSVMRKRTIVPILSGVSKAVDDVEAFHGHVSASAAVDAVEQLAFTEPHASHIRASHDARVQRGMNPIQAAEWLIASKAAATMQHTSSSSSFGVSSSAQATGSYATVSGGPGVVQAPMAMGGTSLEQPAAGMVSVNFASAESFHRQPASSLSSSSFPKLLASQQQQQQQQQPRQQLHQHYQQQQLVSTNGKAPDPSHYSAAAYASVGAAYAPLTQQGGGLPGIGLQAQGYPPQLPTPTPLSLPQQQRSSVGNDMQSQMLYNNMMQAYGQNNILTGMPGAPVIPPYSMAADSNSGIGVGAITSVGTAPVSSVGHNQYGATAVMNYHRSSPRTLPQSSGQVSSHNLQSFLQQQQQYPAQSHSSDIQGLTMLQRGSSSTSPTSFGYADHVGAAAAGASTMPTSFTSHHQQHQNYSQPRAQQAGGGGLNNIPAQSMNMGGRADGEFPSTVIPTLPLSAYSQQLTAMNVGMTTSQGAGNAMGSSNTAQARASSASFQQMHMHMQSMGQTSGSLQGSAMGALSMESHGGGSLQGDATGQGMDRGVGGAGGIDDMGKGTIAGSGGIFLPPFNTASSGHPGSTSNTDTVADIQRLLAVRPELRSHMKRILESRELSDLEKKTAARNLMRQIREGQPPTPK